ncbi:hypothetical protein F5Y10DRAFT_270998 [Nemania abortiva]|nr:hypothetical protein F5Y10DRAFT_270998 [Nemania abortiva]
MSGLDGLIVDGCTAAAAVPPTTTPDTVVAPSAAAAPANDPPTPETLSAVELSSSFTILPRPPLPPPLPNSYHKLSKIASSNQIAEDLRALLQKQIADSFEGNKSVTKKDCDDLAARIVGGPLEPSSLQGATSYTIVAADGAGPVVQFRPAGDAFNLGLLRHVEETYGLRFVPRHEYVGMLGHVYIYKMSYIGGVSALLTRDQFREDGGRLLRIALKDFARFYASAWRNGPPATVLEQRDYLGLVTPSSMPRPDRGEFCAAYRAELEELHDGLPGQFPSTLARLLRDLPSLLAKDLQLVLNHSDLVENNIHVLPETGHLEGIGDWRSTFVCPFGISLDEIECLLGESTKESTGEACYAFDALSLILTYAVTFVVAATCVVVGLLAVVKNKGTKSTVFSALVYAAREGFMNNRHHR